MLWCWMVFCLRGGILLDSVAARNEIFEKIAIHGGTFHLGRFPVHGIIARQE